MNHSHNLPSLSLLGADLTWLDMYIRLSLLNPCLHSGERRYNLKNCLNVLNRVRTENFQKTFRTTVAFSMDMKYEFVTGNN